MEDRVVHNIRLSFTAQDDYRFQVNIAWDPPVYPYKNVTRYYVWNWKGDNKFISFNNTVSVDKFISTNVVASFVISETPNTLFSGPKLRKNKCKKDVFVGPLIIVSSHHFLPDFEQRFVELKNSSHFQSRKAEN